MENRDVGGACPGRYPDAGDEDDMTADSGSLSGRFADEPELVTMLVAMARARSSRDPEHVEGLMHGLGGDGTGVGVVMNSGVLFQD